MSRCYLYTPEQNRKGTDKERHPTTLKPEEYGKRISQQPRRIRGYGTSELEILRAIRYCRIVRG